MSAEDSSDDDSNEGAPASRDRTSTRGRRVGVVLFWVMCTYLIGMSARSIIPALYFPSAAPQPSPASANRCAAELDTLQRELSDAAAKCLAQRRINSWDARLARWDARFGQLSGGDCGPYEPARADLQSLRDQLDRLIRDYGDGALQTQQRLRSALAAFAGVGSS